MAITDRAVFCLAFSVAEHELTLTAVLHSAMTGQWTTETEVIDYLGDLHDGELNRQK